MASYFQEARLPQELPVGAVAGPVALDGHGLARATVARLGDDAEAADLLVVLGAGDRDPLPLEGRPCGGVAVDGGGGGLLHPREWEKGEEPDGTGCLLHRAQ